MKLKTEHKIPAAIFFVVMSVWVLAAGLAYASASSGSAVLSVCIHRTFRQDMCTSLFYSAACIGAGMFFSRQSRKPEGLKDGMDTLIAALASTHDGIALTDDKDRYVFVNDAYAKLYGYTASEMIGKTCLDLVPPEMVAHAKHILHEVLRNRKIGVFNGEMSALLSDGKTLPVEVRATSLWDGAGNYQGHTCIVYDISQQKMDKETIEQSVRFLETIFHSIRDPFIILDRDYTIVRANQAYADLKHIALKDLLERKCYRVTRSRSSVCEECIVSRTFRSGDPSAKEKKVLTKHGTDEWIEIYTYPIVNEVHEVTHVIEYVRNITDRKRSEEERQLFIRDLEMLSSLDTLTGLLNRRMLFDRLGHEIVRVRRYNAELALMFCDLDYFKEINDTYGHRVGDAVLQLTSEILRKSLRSSDIIGRYGGDEFLVILPGTSLKGAHDLAERIRAAVQEMQFEVCEGRSVSITMSIGVICYAGGEADVDALINQIDTALYVSKRSGKNRVYSLA